VTKRCGIVGLVGRKGGLGKMIGRGNFLRQENETEKGAERRLVRIFCTRKGHGGGKSPRNRKANKGRQKPTRGIGVMSSLGTLVGNPGLKYFASPVVCSTGWIGRRNLSSICWKKEERAKERKPAQAYPACASPRTATQRERRRGDKSPAGGSTGGRSRATNPRAPKSDFQ